MSLLDPGILYTHLSLNRRLFDHVINDQHLDKSAFVARHRATLGRHFALAGFRLDETRSLGLAEDFWEYLQHLTAFTERCGSPELWPSVRFLAAQVSSSLQTPNRAERGMRS